MPQYQLLSEQQEEMIGAYKNAFEIINKCIMAIPRCKTLEECQDFGRLIRDAVSLAEIQTEQVEKEMYETGTYSKTPLS